MGGAGRDAGWVNKRGVSLAGGLLPVADGPVEVSSNGNFGIDADLYGGDAGCQTPRGGSSFVEIVRGGDDDPEVINDDQCDRTGEQRPEFVDLRGSAREDRQEATN